MARTPELAVWLLRTFGSGDSIEALIGDLTEECEAGRSQSWFWGQALVAILASFAADIRSHKFDAFRAIGLGCLLFLVWQLVLVLTVGSRMPYASPTSDTYMAATFRVINGALVAQQERVPVPTTLIYGPPIWLVGETLGAVIIGWLVATCQWRLRGPSVFLVAVVLTAVLCWVFPLSISGRLQEGATLAQPLLTFVRIMSLIPAAVFLGVCVGGSVAVRAKRTMSRTEPEATSIGPTARGPERLPPAGN